MNTIEKEKQQKSIVQNLGGIDLAVKAAVTAKDGYRAKIQDLTQHGTKTYTQEHIEQAMNKIKSDMAASMVTVSQDIAKRLDELGKLIHERDAVLDLSNPALSNALSLIQTIGGGLTYEDAVKINANFTHDQSALNAIRAAYKARGVVSTGKIDSLIYNADEVINGLKELAYQAFVQDGSINFFADKLGKLVSLEGTTIETLPDMQGADEAMRRAAGLRVN